MIPGDSATSADAQALAPILSRWSEVGRSGLLPALIEAQALAGWLPPATITTIAHALGVPPVEAFGVADFYDHLYTRPIGRTIIRVCDDVPCYLNGSERICARVAARLGIVPGETTADGAYTLEIVPCLGHCEHAPVLAAGATLHTHATEEQVDRLFE